MCFSSPSAKSAAKIRFQCILTLLLYPPENLNSNVAVYQGIVHFAPIISFICLFVCLLKVCARHRLIPFIFLCHFNDLPSAVKSQVRLFADDCLLYREVNTTQDHYTLQEDLRQLEAWADTWGMRVNASKCHILSLLRSSSFFYQLNGTILQRVTSDSYLGIRISEDLRWGPHISGITKKANSTLGFIRRNLRRCPRACRNTAYLALVRPLLEYGAAVWDP